VTYETVQEPEEKEVSIDEELAAALRAEMGPIVNEDLSAPDEE